MKASSVYLVIAVSLIGLITIIFIPPIAQDPAYHNFADQRTVLTIPHFWNVVTNLPFLMVGLMGILFLSRNSNITLLSSIKPVYFVFFIGICLVCFGSAYYHLAPDNNTLMWDRLPMTITFMSFFCVVVAEFLSEVAAKKLFIPLLLTGLFSVLYWHYSELYSHGDLRLYILVQFLPMLLIPLILFRGQSCFTHNSYYWLILLIYVFAKLLEFYDTAVFELLGFISGHSLKHIISAIGPYFFYMALKKRNYLPLSKLSHH